MQQQAVVKTVARHRPDILDLLTEINAGQSDGVSLDSLHFKKGQVVSVTGQAGNMEQMWKFQANLREQKGIKSAEISNATPDTKTKKIKFTMTFHYKEFTKKEAAL
jgi:Tfp pilus assembly protein PilN